MKKIPSAVGLAFALLVAFHCGKKGNLLPPLAKTPSPPKISKLLQRGHALVLEWTNPETYIDGHPLPGVAEVEVWVQEDVLSADKPLPPPSGDEFPAKAKLVARIPESRFQEHAPGGPEAARGLIFQHEMKDEKPEAKRIVFGLRAKDEGGRSSDFSALSGIRPRLLPMPPSDLNAVVGNEAVTLSWRPPAENINGSRPAKPKGYNIYRSEGGQGASRLNNALVRETTFADGQFVFGRSHRYVVRAATEESEPFWESADSPALDVKPEDTFAPAAPKGLTVISSRGLLTLTWDPNGEKDLAGYRVWRRDEGQEEFSELTTEPLRMAAFQDQTVEKGRRYDYAITAHDEKGNQSPRSEVVSETVRDRP